ncbi:MAG: SAM-dependent methyltransferase [Puniceicoccales bacterium]|nr:SAM-dependent methyltransferase [Puniceicoccales bacterium]
MAEEFLENLKKVEPRCPLFPRCGGCQYQHVAYGDQLALKRRKIQKLFAEFDLERDVVQPTVPSPLTYGYRTKLTPHYGRIRGSGEEPIGFLAAEGRPIIDVPQCPIAAEEINGALPACRQRIRSTVTRRGGTALLRRTDGGVVEDPRALARETVCGKVFHFIAGEFFQNNGAILPDLIGTVRDMATAPEIDFLVDAYCGVGLFSLSLAESFQKVAGIEICRESVRLARLNGSIQGVGNGQFFAGTAEDIFAAVDFPADRTALVLDPPRTGCGRAFADQLLRFQPRRVVYVSCGPEAQVRDLRPLLGTYAIRRVQPMDLFPQTRHIENLVLLERPRTGERVPSPRHQF